MRSLIIGVAAIAVVFGVELPHALAEGSTSSGITSVFVSKADISLASCSQTPILTALIAASDADLAPLLHEELQAAVSAYQDLKAKAGQLDFLDLLIKARDLIRDNKRIRVELQQRFTHYFVDEFQDTDPLQAEILLLLAAKDPSKTDWRKVQPIPGKLFLVGDPKQSIYRFRRADVELHEQVKKSLVACGAELLHLTTSFRAVPSIQSFVNAAFAPAITAGPDGSQPAYVPLQHSRSEIAGCPTVIALPVPRPYGDYGTIVNWRIDESFPDAVGAFIGWLVNESGWTVEEGGKWVTISPRHVCILFRRFRNFSTDVTRSYVRALEARRIPHVLVGGRSFHDREEIIALRNALNAIEWPDDELQVFATLRGPFFALRDDALLAFRQRMDGDGILHVWWDPAVLVLNVEEKVSLRQQRILEADPDNTASAASEGNYARWKLARDEVLARASRPSISVQTVTSASRGAAGDDKIQVEVVARAGAERPGGRRFGALVHGILAFVDLDATSEEISTVSRIQGRLVGASEPEVEAAMQTIIAALSHPIMRRAASVTASNLRRETPILLRREDGTLVEGVVDLAFREETADSAGWTVVDFKTDREFDLYRAEYTAQVSLYAQAIEKATDSSVSGILLVI